MKPFVIFAPHIDDELIGCYPYLSARLVSHVYYFYELTPDRVIEALNCADRFEFIPVFMESDTEITLQKDTTILAPSIYDLHPDHKKVNRLARTFNNQKKYYSVDMNNGFEVLPPDAQANKKSALFALYPSQHALFANEKYYLFQHFKDDESLKMIWVTFQKEGIHRYPAALNSPELADVRFLGFDHRHMFHFKVSIEVFHDDRDLEFIQFKRWLISLYDNKLEFNHKSCEMLADDLANTIQQKYPNRKLTIEVSEDGENGVTVEYSS